VNNKTKIAAKVVKKNDIRKNICSTQKNVVYLQALLAKSVEKSTICHFFRLYGYFFLKMYHT
jgi:hypothetical protein